MAMMGSDFIEKQVRSGKWRPERVPARVAGTSRDLTIYRARRAGILIKHDWHGDAATFCPPRWYDLGIGSGACGFGCRACFLMLTFRAMRDPLAPLIYDNIEDFVAEVRNWLRAERWRSTWVPAGSQATARWIPRTATDTLGLGVDCCDSLLYEGVTGLARRLIPLFADPAANPKGNQLVLLTKSANAHYLQGLPTRNVAVTFSLNPEPAADLWEGKWADTLERITPPIAARLRASIAAQEMGFEVRWRVDPVLTPPGWEALYERFFQEAAALGCRPSWITLGTYREKTAQLDLWRARWGLPLMEWRPAAMEQDGSHRHLSETTRADIYAEVHRGIRAAWPGAVPSVELCKETHAVRKAVQQRAGFGGTGCCNCLHARIAKRAGV